MDRTVTNFILNKLFMGSTEKMVNVVDKSNVKQQIMEHNDQLVFRGVGLWTVSRFDNEINFKIVSYHELCI